MTIQGKLADQQVDGFFDTLKPLFRLLVTVFVAGMGMLLCGTVGSLAYPVAGVGAIFGSIIGFLIFLCFGCCATGMWKDLLPKDQKTIDGRIRSLVPHAIALNMGYHGNFQMILTVHEVQHVHMQYRMPWRQMDVFVEVECGKNPAKRTCVKNDGKYNEQFKFDVQATDESMLIRIRNQDVFGSSDLGYVCIDIQREIIDAGFPCKARFPIEAGAGDKMRFEKGEEATIMLSFDVTEDYPVDYNTQAAEKQARHERDLQLGGQWNSQSYGAVSYLSQLEFNPSIKIGRAKAPGEMV